MASICEDIGRDITRHHQHGRWQVRIGRVGGNKYFHLGTEEEAAEVYNIVPIKFRGSNVVTNCETSRYDVERINSSENFHTRVHGRKSIKVIPFSPPAQNKAKRVDFSEESMFFLLPTIVYATGVDSLTDDYVKLADGNSSNGSLCLVHSLNILKEGCSRKNWISMLYTKANTKTLKNRAKIDSDSLMCFQRVLWPELSICCVVFDFSDPHVKVKEQKWTVEILLMVLVYAIDSIISLSYSRFYILCEILRNGYEAFARYYFGWFSVAGLGGETGVVELFESGTKKQLGEELYRIMKFGIVQYMIFEIFCVIGELEVLEETNMIEFQKCMVQLFHLRLFFAVVEMSMCGLSAAWKTISNYFSTMYESTSDTRKKNIFSRGVTTAIEDSAIDFGDFLKGSLPGKFLQLLGFLTLYRLGIYVPIVGVNSEAFGSDWSYNLEPLGITKSNALAKLRLLEQINTIADASDYLCSTSINIKGKEAFLVKMQASLYLQFLGHILNAFVNKNLAGSAFERSSNVEVISMKGIMDRLGKLIFDLLSGTVGLQNYGGFFDTWGTGVTVIVLLISNNIVLALFSRMWTYQVGINSEDKDLSIGLIQWSTGVSDLSKDQLLVWYKTSFNAPDGYDPIALDLIGTMKHLMNAVNSLPELTERKKVIEKHMSILSVLLYSIKERTLDAYCNVENDMLAKGSVDKNTLLNVLKGKGTKTDKLRLALIYLLAVETSPLSESQAMEEALNEVDIDWCVFHYVKKIKSVNTTLASATSASKGVLVPKARPVKKIFDIDVWLHRDFLVFLGKSLLGRLTKLKAGIG